MKSINPASSVRKHFQLREILLDMIERDFAVDDSIPSERDLCARYGLARMTVRQTIDNLVNDGRLYRVHGKGTFVARPKIGMEMRLASFSEDMRAHGFEPGSVELSRQLVQAGRHVGLELGLAPDEPVHIVERVRTADGVPMAIERNYYPAALTPGLLDEPLKDISLFTVLVERYGLVFDDGQQSLEAGIADASDAELLQVPKGSAVLHYTRRALAAGRPVEYVIATYRGDRYRVTLGLDVPAPQPRRPVDDVLPTR